MKTQRLEIRPNLKVVMQLESEMIDEVIVVAYGTSKKSSFTGSAQSIDGKKTQGWGTIDQDIIIFALNIPDRISQKILLTVYPR